MHRTVQLAAWGYVAVCAALIWRASGREPVTAAFISSGAPAGGGPIADAVEWFRRVKPYCNSVEIGFVRGNAPPAGWQGSGFLAACHALAGRIDESRRIIDRLPKDEQWRAAGIIFDVGHPIADAGDDRAAGPIMELVVDYWPNHYMALYHAGMAEYMLGQSALAERNLSQFLRIYTANDGWTRNAREVLTRLKDPAGAGAKDLRRPMDP